MNQDSHQGAVAERSVSQVKSPPDSDLVRREGTLTSALSRQRIVRVRVCHSIASSTPVNELGRFER